MEEEEGERQRANLSSTNRIEGVEKKDGPQTDSEWKNSSLVEGKTSEKGGCWGSLLAPFLLFPWPPVLLFKMLHSAELRPLKQDAYAGERAASRSLIELKQLPKNRAPKQTVVCLGSGAPSSLTSGDPLMLRVDPVSPTCPTSHSDHF